MNVSSYQPPNNIISNSEEKQIPINGGGNPIILRASAKQQQTRHPNSTPPLHPHIKKKKVKGKLNLRYLIFTKFYLNYFLINWKFF